MSVFNFSDYKEFIEDFITNLPKAGRGEINRIGEKIEVHPTLVSQVLRGNKDFSIEQAHKLCQYLGLAELETDYFLNLVQLARAGTEDLRKYYRHKLKTLKESSLDLKNRLTEHRALSDYERSVFYSSWIYSAVRLFTSVDSGKSVDDCALKFSLPRNETAKILNFLTSAQLVTERNGLYSMISAHTHLEFGSPFLGRHHSNWRMKAIQRSDQLSSEELMFTSPFSVSRKDFERIREALTTVIKENSQIIKDSPAEDVACINIDLFWMRTF